jgi:hypothetical protein
MEGGDETGSNVIPMRRRSFARLVDQRCPSHAHGRDDATFGRGRQHCREGPPFPLREKVPKIHRFAAVDLQAEVPRRLRLALREEMPERH